MARSDSQRRALGALRLSHFRNYISLSLTLDARPVALFGSNGAGKTNILEAISCLTQGRGLRRAANEELARRTNGARTGDWAVSADLVADGTAHRVGVGQDPANPSRRLVRIDGANATATELGNLVRVAWLTPAQDRVFAGPRSDRMRFFDRLTLALSPTHGAAAVAYDRALRERTRLLEESRADPVWLDGVEAEMARHGLALAMARRSMASRLQSAVDARSGGAFPSADIGLTGWIEERLPSDGGADLAALEQDFRDALAEARRRDARAGRALDGPHRADLVVVHRDKQMPAGDCSTGEQKALLVGLALGHARALEAASGHAAPLVLLDEAAAHLDPSRRAALADEICDLGVQAWLTGTDADLFDSFGARAQFVHIEEGAVVETPAGV